MASSGIGVGVLYRCLVIEPRKLPELRGAKLPRRLGSKYVEVRKVQWMNASENREHELLTNENLLCKE